MKKSALTLDSSYLYEDKLPAKPSLAEKLYFISGDTQSKASSKVSDSIERIESKIANQDYDFIEVLKDTSYLDKVKNTFTNIKWAECLVVVGIGGSDLGGRTIIEAFDHNESHMKVLFTGDSTDPVAFRRILDQVDLRKTVFNIVSKSGSTLETLSSYVFFKQEMRKVEDNWQKHFVFTTSKESGVLKDEADEHSIITLPVPEGVGGRFSVLTPVGLLPALAVGVDIDALVQGALTFAQSDSSREMAQQFATSQFELYQQGIKISVMMAYSVQLQEFARWFRQLWAESLGKDDSGILPIKSWGPADQHSQTQFYNQGTPFQSLLFIKVLNRQTNFTLEGVDVGPAKYLEGKDFNYILNVEADASAESIFNHGRPSAMLSVEELTPASLGELFMLFELAVVYLAEMLEVNAFDQPGVEEGKRIINKTLGK